MATKDEEQALTVSEAAKRMRLAAAECPPGDFKDRLAQMSERLEKISSHHFFATGRGRREVGRFLEEIETLRAALEACQEEGPAQTYCANFFKQMEQIFQEVQGLETR